MAVLRPERPAPSQRHIYTTGQQPMDKHRVWIQVSLVTLLVRIGSSNMLCSGILTAYAQEKHSDIFASAYASSAPVQADGDFW